MAQLIDSQKLKVSDLVMGIDFDRLHVVGKEVESLTDCGKVICETKNSEGNRPWLFLLSIKQVEV